MYCRLASRARRGGLRAARERGVPLLRQRVGQDGPSTTILLAPSLFFIWKTLVFIERNVGEWCRKLRNLWPVIQESLLGDMGILKMQELDNMQCGALASARFGKRCPRFPFEKEDAVDLQELAEQAGQNSVASRTSVAAVAIAAR